MKNANSFFLVQISTFIGVLSFGTLAVAGTLKYKPEYFDKVQIEADVGTFQVVGGGDGNIETTPGPLWSEKNCELYSELDGRTLKIRLGYKEDLKKEMIPQVNCEARVVVRIPAFKDIEIDSATSDITLDGMTGRSKIALKKGGLDIHSDLAELDVRGDSVALTSSGAISKMKVQLDQKNLSLEMKKLGSSPLTKVALDISDLKTDVILPPTAKLKARISGDGIQARLKSDFTNPEDSAKDDELDFELKLNSDAGAVGIRKI